MSSSTLTKPSNTYSRAQGIAIAVVGAALMSLDPIFIRYSGVSGFDTAFLFGLFTAISMSVLLQVTDKKGLIRIMIEGGWPLFFAGLLMVGSASGLVFSVKNTSVANTFVILSSTPAIAAVFSWFLLKEKTTPKTMLAIGATIIGILIVVSGSIGSGHGGSGAEHWTGDLMAAGAVICLSLMFVLLRKYPHVNRMASVALGGLFVAITMSFFAEPSTYSNNTWFVMAAMGMFSAPIGRVLTKVATRYASAPEVTMTLMLETVLAPVWAFIFFREIPALNSMIGGCLIFITIALYTIDAFKSEKASS
ncbi:MULTISPECIES: DMT family transporter [unclassified Vibrio]|uniref:DMT family transporter n=1 Tax=unclassified Vibrio TaxID=2614977 RepID=UPI001F1A2F44|nr:MULTISPECIES: DMT family transporter [unclassified Vibrio]QXL80207.1 hypothetical protein [Vibrio sp.]